MYFSFKMISGLLFVMLVLVRGDPAFTKTEVIGLDILAPRHPKLYSLIVGRLGYDINTNTNIVSNRQGNVDESCQPDATGRQICLKVSLDSHLIRLKLTKMFITLYYLFIAYYLSFKCILAIYVPN